MQAEEERLRWDEEREEMLQEMAEEVRVRERPRLPAQRPTLPPPSRRPLPLLTRGAPLEFPQAAERRRLLQQQNSERAAHKQERLKLIYQVEALMTQVRAADLAARLHHAPLLCPRPPPR